MFVWSVTAILSAFDEHMPEMKRVWDKSSGQVKTAYPEMTATSIDFGLMEKSTNVVTFPLECGWDDLGSWTSVEALGRRLGREKAEGVVLAGETVAHDSHGNVVEVPGKCVALLGVQDLVVVESGGALLIAHKSRVQDVKVIVEKIKIQRPDLA